MTLVQKAVFPAVWLLEGISGFILGSFRKKETTDSDTLMEVEFRSLVDAGHEEGIIDASQRDLIHRVFDLADTPVEDIMTPRVDMFCLPVSTSPRSPAKSDHRAGILEGPPLRDGTR